MKPVVKSAEAIVAALARFYRDGAAPLQPGAQLFTGPDDELTIRDAVLNWAEAEEARPKFRAAKAELARRDAPKGGAS